MCKTLFDVYMGFDYVSLSGWLFRGFGLYASACDAVDDDSGGARSAAMAAQSEAKSDQMYLMGPLLAYL